MTLDSMRVEKAMSRFSSEISWAFSLGIRMDVVVIKLALLMFFQEIPLSSIQSSIVTGTRYVASDFTCQRFILFPNIKTSSFPITSKEQSTKEWERGSSILKSYFFPDFRPSSLIIFSIGTPR